MSERPPAPRHQEGGMSVEVHVQIRRLREHRKMLAQDLADQIGIDASAMSRIEHGTRKVSTAELVRIAKALRCSPLALLDADSLLAKMAYSQSYDRR